MYVINVCICTSNYRCVHTSRACRQFKGHTVDLPCSVSPSLMGREGDSWWTKCLARFHQTRTSNEKPIDFPLQPSAATKKENKPLHCYLFFLLFHPSLDGQKKEGNSSQVLLHTFNLSFAPPSLCMSPSLHLSFCLSLSLASSLPSACLSLSHSVPLSWCKVMEAGVCGSRRARLRDYTARSHERFMMLGSVCVCVCVSLTLRHWLEKGNRERRRKKERGWGMEGTECETNWRCTAGLTLQAAIILLASLHTLSDAILVRSALQKWPMTKVWNRNAHIFGV